MILSTEKYIIQQKLLQNKSQNMLKLATVNEITELHFHRAAHHVVWKSNSALAHANQIFTLYQRPVEKQILLGIFPKNLFHH